MCVNIILSLRWQDRYRIHVILWVEVVSFTARYLATRPRVTKPKVLDQNSNERVKEIAKPKR